VNAYELAGIITSGAVSEGPVQPLGISDHFSRPDRRSLLSGKESRFSGNGNRKRVKLSWLLVDFTCAKSVLTPHLGREICADAMLPIEAGIGPIVSFAPETRPPSPSGTSIWRKA
jgi:hypothetical protein